MEFTCDNIWWDFILADKSTAWQKQQRTNTQKLNNVSFQLKIPQHCCFHKLINKHKKAAPPHPVHCTSPC